MCCVVIIGLGIVFCFGNDKDIVFVNFCVGWFGICFNLFYVEMGLCSYVFGLVDLNFEELIDCKVFCFMGDVVVYVYLVMEQVIKDFGLILEQIFNFCIGLIVGFGGVFILNQMEVIDILCEKGVKCIGLYCVICIMGSIVLVCLVMLFQIKGVNYLIFFVCVISVYCIGQVMEQIQLGKQDVVFVGGGEEEYWSQSCLFDVMGVFFIQYNEMLEKVFCVYDVKCDGFVIVGGGGMVVVEELEYVFKCGVKIYVEIVGYGVIFDGYDMVVLSGEGVICCMQQVLVIVDVLIDYLNIYGIFILVGDVVEI